MIVYFGWMFVKELENCVFISFCFIICGSFTPLIVTNDEFFIFFAFDFMSNIPTAELVSHAKEVYTRVFGGEAEIVTSAPGRLNFGGEHCDYMGGYVLPFPTVLRGVAAGRRVPGKV